MSEPSTRPDVGPASTTRGYRLTAGERSDLCIALMLAIHALNPTCPRCASTHVRGQLSDRFVCVACNHDWDAVPHGNQGYRLRQLLDRFHD